MARVIAVIKVMPESMERFEEIKNRIIEMKGISKVEEEPIAFVLKALKITVVVEDAKGGTEKIEKDLQDLSGVSSIEVIAIGRL